MVGADISRIVPSGAFQMGLYLPRQSPFSATATQYYFLSAYLQLTQRTSSISPQLMHVPAASKTVSDLDEAEEKGGGEDVAINDKLHTIPENHIQPTRQQQVEPQRHHP